MKKDEENNKIIKENNRKELIKENIIFEIFLVTSVSGSRRLSPSLAVLTSLLPFTPILVSSSSLTTFPSSVESRHGRSERRT